MTGMSTHSRKKQVQAAVMLGLSLACTVHAEAAPESTEADHLLLQPLDLVTAGAEEADHQRQAD